MSPGKTFERLRKCTTMVLMAALLNAPSVRSQSASSWTESDRRFLIDNLIKSRDSLIVETSKLTEAQWNFHESPDRWSINQVVEHLAIYELIYQKEINTALRDKGHPEYCLNAKPDSFYVDYILETNPHITTDYTKPFTYSVPMGINDGKNNLAWFLKMRAESINYLDSTTQNLRIFFSRPDRPNLHQVYIYVFGHTYRHLRQIRKIKENSNYPK